MTTNKDSHPPRLADRFLKWFCRKELLEEIKGDLHEVYDEETIGMPKWRAALFYWIQMLNFLRPFAINGQHSNHTIMIVNYLKFAYRNLLKHKTSALLNIMSLSIGIACFAFIFVYLYSELKYDTFHKEAELIYRVPIDFVDSKNNRLPDATTPPALAPALVRDFPEVASAVRIFPGWGSHFRLGTEDGKQFFEADLIRTDSTFFEIFTFPFLYGDPNAALSTPDQIVLTRKMALKYFGRADVVGEKILSLGSDEKAYQVSAVLQDLPVESHFHFDFLTKITFDGLEQNWGWYNYYTYIKMRPGIDMMAFESKLQPFYESYLDADSEYYNIIYTQPLTSIHLHSHLKWELQPNGDINNIYIFGALAVFVLIVSCLNYINLTMSQSVRRFKEVGVRKVFGANKASLTSQFVVETLFSAFISLLVGFFIVEFALQRLNPILGKELTLLNMEGIWLVLIISGVVLVIGLLAGLFPAFHLSSFQVAMAVKGLRRTSGQSVKQMRSGLLIIQFAISTLMILGALVVNKQLNFMMKVDKGFEPEQVLVIENGREVENYQVFKNKLLQIPSVKSVSNASGILGKLNWTTSVGYPDPFVMNFLAIDADFIETMEMKTIKGRAFSSDIGTDKQGWNMMVNETAMRELGISDSDLGTSIPIRSDGDSLIFGTVLGVLSDFQFTDLKMNTKPFAFFYRDEPLGYISMKVKEADITRTLSMIEDAWYQASDGAPIDYFFMDQVYNDLLNEESRLSQLMFGLTLLSFFIAFMGMFSMANLTLKDKTKEIAIRKVLGSSELSLIRMVTHKFLRLVLVANLISIPLAYFFAQRWLENFSYRTPLGVGLIVLVLSCTGLVVILVVGSQALRTASQNPVKNLRQN